MKKVFYLILFLPFIWTPLSGAENEHEQQAHALVAALSPINFVVDLTDDTITVAGQDREWHMTDVSYIVRYAQNKSQSLRQWINNWIVGRDLDNTIPEQAKKRITKSRTFLIGAFVTEDADRVDERSTELLYFNAAFSPDPLAHDDQDYIPGRDT